MLGGGGWTVRNTGLFLIALFFLLTAIAAVYTLEDIESRARQEAGETLRAVLNTTNEALGIWIRENLLRAQRRAADPALELLARQQLQLIDNQGQLLASQYLEALQLFFESFIDRLGGTGFYLIGPDSRNVAAHHPEAIGEQNPIGLHRARLLSRVYLGETVFVPPVRIGDQTPAHFVAPIRSADGEVIAALALCVDPLEDLSRIIGQGRIGKSSETYAFDSDGMMVSESRFSPELRRHGLLGVGESPILSVRVADPGVPIDSAVLEGGVARSWPLTRLVSAAIRSGSGQDLEGYRGYLGTQVIGVWTWDASLEMGLATENRLVDAMASFNKTKNIVLMLFGITSLLSMVLMGSILWISERANKALAAGREELEVRVQQRTSELEKSEARLWDLYDNAPVAYFSLDPVDGSVLKHNKAFAELLGYERMDFARLKLSDLCSDATCKLLEAARLGQEIQGQEVRLTRKQSGWILGSISTSRQEPLTDGPGELRVSVVDITDQKAADDTIRRARDLADDANRAKSEFLANMSHEIRTPLNAIMGMTHLVLETDLSTRQRSYLDKVQGAAQSLLQIINDILDFSKVEAGRLQLESIEFELHDILDKISNYIGIKARAKGLELLFSVSPAVPLRLLGDPLRLGQILINLCGNAVKFTEQGEIRVLVSLLERQGRRTKLEFMVRDTGIGMTPEQQGRLFRQFAQGDSSITRRYGGTGLGLTISKRLIELYGGEISMESRPEEGSSFRFSAWFGLAETASTAGLEKIVEAAEEGASARVRLAGARILLVEDNQINQELTAQLLTDAGMSVVVAGNGEEALVALDREAFDGVLMDIQMPHMDGYAAIREIRRRPALESLPVIAMTANALAEDRVRCLAAGMDGYITKPLDVEEMFVVMAGSIHPAESISDIGAGAKEVDRQDSAQRGTGPDSLASALRQLYGLVLEDDTGAVDWLPLVRELMPDALSRARLDQVTNRLGDYDFEAAAEILRGLVLSLEIDLDSPVVRDHEGV